MEEQPTLVLEVKTISPLGLGGQKKSSFDITIDDTQTLIAIYLRGTQKFDTLRIFKKDKKIAEVHSWMIDSIKTIYSGKEGLTEKYIKELKELREIKNIQDFKDSKKKFGLRKDNGKKHTMYTMPIILCAYNVLNDQDNFEHTTGLLNMWLKEYNTLRFEFTFDKPAANKDFRLYLHIKRNPLSLVKGLAKSFRTSVGNVISRRDSKIIN